MNAHAKPILKSIFEHIAIQEDPHLSSCIFEDLHTPNILTNLQIVILHETYTAI